MALDTVCLIREQDTTINDLIIAKHLTYTFPYYRSRQKMGSRLLLL